MTWSIRPKGERDSAAIAALLGEVSREGGYIATEWPFDVEERGRSMREALLSRVIIGWVAVDGATLAGDLTVFAVDGDEPLLGMMVAAPYRGRGIGRALLEAVFAWGRQNGKPALGLRVFPDNSAALALYAATGFVQVALEPRSIPSRDGSARDAIYMRKTLARDAREVAPASAGEEETPLSRVRRSHP